MQKTGKNRLPGNCRVFPLFMLCTVLLGFPLFACYTLDPERQSSPNYRDGRYQNLYDDSDILSKGLSTVLYWKWFGELEPPSVDSIPSGPPEVSFLKRDDFYPPNGIVRIIWLGHATTWIAATVDHRTYHLILDPVFGDVLTRPRMTELPLAVDKIPAVDAALVSHAHRDHLDLPTLVSLARKNDDTLVFLPSGMRLWASEEGLNSVIQEWWDTNQIGPFNIQYMPAQHWSRMGINDTMQYHWGGYWIKVGKRNIFFAGDTAYSPHFKDIRRSRPESLDLAIMPVGAFKPRWFMKAAHIDALEALQASADLQATRMVPVHWGTFELGDDLPRESSLYLKHLVARGMAPENLEVIHWKPGQFLDLHL
ncbi:MAG: MBL fold metallo-hydrolase [Leptospiraceae bacterium]